MTTILSGYGSSIVHAVTAASAQSLGNVRVQGQCLDVDTTGSCNVAVTVVTDPRVPIGTLYYGGGPTVALALTAAGVSSSNAGVLHQAVGRQNTGSVHVLMTLSNEAIPATLYSGTGSTITHALSVSGVSGVTNPRVVHQDIARDGLGSVTVLYAITSDERVPR